MSYDVEKMNGTASLLFKGTLSVGVLVVLIYCVRIGFFPVGLTLSDSLLFIFLAVGFGVFYVLWIGMGFICVYGSSLAYDECLKTRSRSIIKQQNRAFTPEEEVQLKYDLSAWIMFTAAVLMFISLVAIAWTLRDVFVLLIPLMSGWICLYATVKWKPMDPGTDPTEVEQREKLRKWMVVVAVAVVPILAMSFINVLVNINMKKLGFRHENVSLILDDKNYKTLTVATRSIGLQILGCPGDSAGNNIVHNVDLLWYGFGERALVQLGGPGKSVEPAARLELDRQGVSVLSLTDMKARRSLSYKACLNLEVGSLFESNGAQPNAQGQRKINEFRRQLRQFSKASGLSVVEVSIAGYADRQPLKAKGDSNRELSRRRALTVSGYLGSLLVPLEDDRKSVLGLGVTRSRAECPDGLAATDLASCLASDRRVEIVVEFGLPQ